MGEKIKRWYLQKLWSEQMVRMAAVKGLLTQNEAEKLIFQEGI